MRHAGINGIVRRAGKSVIQMLLWGHQMTVGGLQLLSCLSLCRDTTSVACYLSHNALPSHTRLHPALLHPTFLHPACPTLLHLAVTYPPTSRPSTPHHPTPCLPCPPTPCHHIPAYIPPLYTPPSYTLPALPSYTVSQN